MRTTGLATLLVMDGAGLLADIRDSLAEMNIGSPEVLTKDEALRIIHGQRRQTPPPSAVQPRRAKRWPGCRKRSPPRPSSSCTAR
jgi:hypothetical protein